MEKSNKRKYATLKDVAELCNLSISAVSKILSGEKNFKAETRDLVMKTAREIGYAPNALARSVANKGGHRSVGFFIPNIMNPFFAELVDKVEKRLSRHNYNLTLCLFDDNAKKMSEFIKMLIETRAAGCIIAASREDECAEDFEIAKDFMAMVSIQSDVNGVDRVDVTDEEGTYEIISYLIKKGHKKIGFLGYRFDMSTLQRRFDGYCKAFRDNNLPIIDDYIIEGKHNANNGYDNTKKLLEMPDPPTAIHCINEFMAVNAYLAVRDLGLRIPEDVSITGFDGLTYSRVLYPPLTTIEDPIDLLATISVDMLMEQLENPDEPQEGKQIYVRHRFLERESVKDLTKE